MLELFRKLAKTWVFKGLFALLILSFAIWGIGDVNFTGAGTRVAAVGEEEVSVQDYAEAMSRELSSLSQRAQRRISLEEAESAGLPQILLARLVRDAALNGEAKRLGVSASDADVRRAIMTSPSFKGLDGSFSEEQYRFVVDRLGFRPEEFEADMRRSLARNVLTYAVAGGAQAAPDLAEAVAAYQMEERRIALIRLPLDAAPAPAAPTEDELKAHIEAERDRFMKPETRSIRWIAIDPEAIAEAAVIPEEELRAVYEAEADRWTRPAARRVEQMVFDDAAAAAAAKARIDAGEIGFAALAAERGATLEDLFLGEGPADAFAPDVAAAAFALAAPGVAGPVETGFGPALLNVAAFTEEEVIPFETARDILRLTQAIETASADAAALAEDAADILAAGAGIDGLAEELRLTVHAAPALTRAGDAAAGPFADDAAFLAEAFEAVAGEERDMIETESGGFALVHVDAVDPAAPLSFEEARAQAEAEVIAARRLDALEAQAAGAVAALNGGADLAETAAGLGAEVETLAPIRRTGGIGQVNVNLLDKLFAAEAGGAALLREGDAVVIGQVLEVIPGDLSDPVVAGQIEELDAQLDATLGEDIYAYYAAALQDKAGASVDQAAMEQALNALR